MPKNVKTKALKSPPDQKKPVYDPELLAVVITHVQKLANEVLGVQELSPADITGIAKQVIHFHRFDDAEWVKHLLKKTATIEAKPQSLSELEAILHSIAPPKPSDFRYKRQFSQFTRTAYQVFCEQFGEEAFEFMLKVLDDPSQASPSWASQFMATVIAIDYKIPSGVKAYAYITQHKKWLENRQARDRFGQRLRELRYRPKVWRAYQAAQKAAEEGASEQEEASKPKAKNVSPKRQGAPPPLVEVAVPPKRKKAKAKGPN